MDIFTLGVNMLSLASLSWNFKKGVFTVFIFVLGQRRQIGNEKEMEKYLYLFPFNF